MSLTHRFKIIYKLTIARNKEFYRDKGSITWAILFPVLLMTGITFAFRNENQEVFKIGILGNIGNTQIESFMSQPWITPIYYDNDEIGTQKALQRVQHHELDLLIQENHPKIFYWINPQSSRGAAVEQLLLTKSIAGTDHYLFRQIINGRAIRYVDWVIPGVLGMNIMFGALFGIGYVIVRYR